MTIEKNKNKLKGNKEENGIEDFKINSYLMAIDKENGDQINFLIKNDNNNGNKKDILLKLYNEKLLTTDRLQFIINNCTKDLNISTSLIKRLMKNNEIELLQIIFKKLKFYDTEIIKYLLYLYKNKIPISLFNLKQELSNEKYKILITINKYDIDEIGSNIFLYSACQNGNENIVKYLIKFGANINIKDKEKETPLFYACRSGNKNLVKYLMKIGGGDIKKKILMVKQYYLKHVEVEMKI